MSQMLRRFFYVWVANATVLVSSAFASGVASRTEALDFSVERSDTSLQMLEQIFGLVDGVLYGTGTQVVGQMFGVFNAAVLALGGIFLTYTLLVSTINTAQDGEVMGKQWSSIWIPIRVTCGVGLLVPKASGYCMMQVFVMWIVVQGIGAANQVWGAALNYLESGGVLTSKPLVSGTESPDSSSNLLNNNRKDVVGSVLQSLVCMNAMERSLQQWEDEMTRQGKTPSESVPDFYSSIRIGTIDLSNTDAAGRPLIGRTIHIPNFDGNSAYSELNGLCGEIEIGDFNFSSTERAAMSPEQATNIENNAKSAILLGSQQIIDELNRTAIVIVDRNEEQSTAFKKVMSGDEVLPASETPLSQYDATDGFGKCKTTPDCKEWINSVGTAPLLTGYELQSAILSYYAIIMPYLNLTNRSAKEVAFVPRAKSQGWMIA